MRSAILSDVETAKVKLGEEKAKLSKALGEKKGEEILKPLVIVPDLFRAECISNRLSICPLQGRKCLFS